MCADTARYVKLLDDICHDTVGPESASVDRGGVFPERSVAALGAAGLLGALSASEVGGLGLGLGDAAAIVSRVAQDCGSTAMILCMHYCGTSVLEKYGAVDIRRAIAGGTHLSTLAFSETGSRSHFWAPVSTATRDGNAVVLNARKSWVTSATRATAYVWSSRPVTGDKPSTIWLVPSNTPGLTVDGPFDGLGLRGNDSSPVSATDVRIDPSNMLGDEGAGFDVMMGTVLPVFNILSASCSIGLMEAGVRRTAEHASGSRYAHLGSSLADLPTVRNYVARMRITTDMVRTLVDDAVTALGAGRPDAMLRVLESKAAAGEAADEVLGTAMRVCGGAAFRKEVGVERYFRDARAASVMAPTTDILYDFIGKAVCGLPLF